MSQHRDGILIGLGIFALITDQQPDTRTHRRTDHATNICNNRPHLCTGCMRYGQIIIHTVDEMNTIRDSISSLCDHVHGTELTWSLTEFYLIIRDKI